MPNFSAVFYFQQGIVNVNPKILEEYFFQDCMKASSEDADDEEFFININFEMFALPDVDTNMDIKQVKNRAQAWSIEVEKETDKKSKPKKKKAKVDTKRLEYFGDVDQFRFLLKHPVMSSFLEMELNHLKSGYWLQFFIYLVYVIVIFQHFGERFTSVKQVNPNIRLSKTISILEFRFYDRASHRGRMELHNHYIYCHLRLPHTYLHPEGVLPAL